MIRCFIALCMAGIVGYILLNLLIDGWLQDGFAHTVIEFLQRLGLGWERANYIYGIVFMENKFLFLMAGFLILFFFFYYIAVQQLTRYFQDIGREVDKILDEKVSPVELPVELNPISEKLNFLKNTLRRRQEAAEESEQRKNDLVVYLAHDLKTPLTSVIAYLTILDEQPQMSMEERVKYTHISLEKALRLGELINEFFEITRFNLQDIKLEKMEVNLSMMLEQLADESYGILTEKRLTCSIQADENLVVDGDPDKLARVFDNLIRNAVAYSYPATNIEIKAYQESNTIVIIFLNQSERIPQQKLNALFDKFYRGDNSRSSQTGGSGLGLSIAREIVELHKGTIEAFSDSYGTRFVVRMPSQKQKKQESL